MRSSGSSGLAIDLRPLSNAHSTRGIGRYVRGLSPALPPGSLTIQERRSHGLPRVTTTLRGWTVRMPPRPRMRLDPLAARMLRPYVERAHLAAVHLQDPYTYAWAPRDARLLLNVYDFLQESASGRLPELFRRGLAEGHRRPDTHWLTISGAVASQIMMRLSVPASRVTVIPPGPTDWPAHEAVHEDVVVVVGALDEHKQPDHALEAARLAGVPVRFLGRYAPEACRSWGISPEQQVPDLDDARLAGRIAGARALVHASRDEGFGLPVLEALSLGTPVAAYELPVTREIVGPDYPLVPQEAGPKGLAALLRDFADESTALDVVNRARPWLRRFEWEDSRSALDRLRGSLA